MLPLNESLESLRFQIDSKLHKGLTSIFESMFKKIELEKQRLIVLGDFNLNKHHQIIEHEYQKIKSDVESIIKQETNISINFVLNKRNVLEKPYFGVLSPVIDRNHPLFNNLERFSHRSDVNVAVLLRERKQLMGHVDLQKGSVDGFFSKIEFSIIVNHYAFIFDLTASEFSAAILHELGHAFSFFYFIGKHYTSNFILSETARQLANIKQEREKYILLNHLDREFNIKFKDQHELFNTKNQETIHLILTNRYIETMYNELNSHMYDLTAWEMLADQFANRHGAGKDLVSLLHKKNKVYKHTHYLSRANFILLEFIKLIMLSLSALLIVPIIGIIVSFLFLNTNYSKYDIPQERFKRIYRDLISALKDETIPREHRNKINEDLKHLQEVIKSVDNRRTLFQWYWNTLHFKGRREFNALKFQKELESLVNNDFFMQSNQLKLLRGN